MTRFFYAGVIVTERATQESRMTDWLRNIPAPGLTQPVDFLRNAEYNVGKRRKKGGRKVDPTVSIIVPVYNGEETIRRCVDSILAQEYRDFELLLVDDGSIDGSVQILDDYGRQDERVRVIHKENTGVSDTRNTAIELARGTYLQFLDSDDWITPDATKLLVRAAEANGCDLVISDFYRVVGERCSHKGDIEETAAMTREEFAACMMENPADYYYGVLWNKLYRRAIVQEHRIRMNTDISWCEDFMFNLEYMHYAKVFFALQVPIYYYVKRKGSLVNQKISLSRTVNMKLTVFEYYNQFCKSVLDEEEYERNRRKVYSFLFDSAQDGAVPLALFPNSTRLGNERVDMKPPQGEGILQNHLRLRRLLEHYLEPIAMKNNLLLPDVLVLLCLFPSGELTASFREIADLTNLSRRSVSASVQKLTARGLLKRRDLPRRRNSPQQTCLELQSAAEPIFTELTQVRADWLQSGEQWS